MFCAPLHSNADFMRSSFSTAFSRSSSATLLLHPRYHDTMPSIVLCIPLYNHSTTHAACGNSRRPRWNAGRAW